MFLMMRKPGKQIFTEHHYVLNSVMGYRKTHTAFYLEQEETGAGYTEVTKCGDPPIQGDK